MPFHQMRSSMVKMPKIKKAKCIELEGTLYNSSNEIMHCKCGKPAGGGVFGHEAFQVWCSDCDPNCKISAEFIYREPNKENPKYKEALKVCESQKT